MLTDPAARRFVIPPFRGEIAAAYDTPEVRALLAELDARRAGPGATVLHAARNTVWTAGPFVSPAGPPAIAVKEFGLRGLNRLKTLVVASKARRAWDGARALQAAGLATAAPIAYGEERRRGLVVRAVFLAEKLDGGSELRDILRDKPAAELEPLLAALAGLVRQGHDRGVVHRDLSDGNVLVFGLGGRASRASFSSTPTASGSGAVPGRTPGPRAWSASGSPPISGPASWTPMPARAALVPPSSFFMSGPRPFSKAGCASRKNPICAAGPAG